MAIDRSEHALCANCTGRDAGPKPDQMRNERDYFAPDHGRSSSKTVFPALGFELPPAVIHAPTVNHVNHVYA